MSNFFYLLIFLVTLSSCTSEDSKTVSQCITCHAVHTDSNHQQACVACHKGDNSARDKDAAHVGYVPHPAHPAHFTASCGPCHPEIVDQITSSMHFTLHKSTNLFRKAFGAKTDLAGFMDTPKKSDPQTHLELADDLLRRRCFRCHVYSSGEAFPSVSHGIGCAACHMAFSEGKLQAHHLQPPEDAQCLSCHYGNYVGFDYYGRFEHDFNVEYRTPYTTKNKYFRPYGVEYHQLTPDIHQSRGMLCIDCHSGGELMGTSMSRPSCAGCHRLEELEQTLPDHVEIRQGLFILRGRGGKDHAIPLLQHPAHDLRTAKINCQACHAQWTFNDLGKHFLRSDTDDFDIWANLSVQGSLAVETIIDNNNDFEKNELAPQMIDQLSGESEPGLWHKGYSLRRWENIILGRDDSGSITTMRPVLDYSLSWIDIEDTVRFDSIQSQAPNMGLRSYVPHTTGPAGLFYQERIEQFLASERSAALPDTLPQEKNATQ